MRKQNNSRRSDRTTNEKLAAIGHINVESTDKTLLVTNYPEDEAVRHAALKAQDAEKWPQYDRAPYYQHRDLTVSFRNPDGTPLSPDDAIERLLGVRESTVLTMRIAMGIWNVRRRNSQLCENGSVPILIDDILSWRGVKKQSRMVGDSRHSNGWHSEDVNSIRNDFVLASGFYVRGYHDVRKRGKVERYAVDSQYMRVGYYTHRSLWRDSEDELLAIFVSPGEWILTYQEAGNYFLAPIERSVFQLNPQNDQHELRIALYLVELWRKQAKKRRYDATIKMEDLLRESVISVNGKNLTSRFIPRIEQALANLQRKAIIGSYECLTPVDKKMYGWGKRWLASEWRIRPPLQIQRALDSIVYGAVSDLAA